MSTTKIPFGAAVANFDERKTLEVEANSRKWTLADVEWLELQLRDEDLHGESTYWRDRRPQLVAAAKRSHERGDFVLVDAMTRGQFAAHLSTEMAPGGVAVPSSVRLTEDDVFSRPEMLAIASGISNLQTLRAIAASTPGAKPVSTAVQEPAMGVIRLAGREGRIMGSNALVIPLATATEDQKRGAFFRELRARGGAVAAEIRGPQATNALAKGVIGFRGESPATLEMRVLEYIARAQEALEVRATLRDAVAQYAQLQQIDGGQGGRVLRSTRDTLASILAELPRTIADLRWFERWILEGDEVTQLQAQLTRIDELLARAA